MRHHLACPAADLDGVSRADELEAEVAATRSELGQEVEQLRDVLDATLRGKAQLASQCSALEAQVRTHTANRSCAHQQF